MVAASVVTKAVKAGRQAAKAKAKSSPLRRMNATTFEQDTAKESMNDLLEQIIETLCEDERHIVPTFCFITKRKKCLENADKGLSQPMFVSLTNFGSIPTESKIDWVVKHSNMDAEQVLALYRHDEDQLDIMMSLALQLPKRLKMPEEFRIIEVCMQFLESRYAECGSRLSSFAPDGITKEMVLNLSEKGSYKLTFDSDKMLELVTHATGASCKIDSSVVQISSRYTLWDNFDDWQARLVMPPLPDIYLWKFFEPTRDGPLAIVNYMGKAQKLQQVAEQHKSDWQDLLKTRGSNSSSADVAVALSDHKKGQARAVMAKAREKAAEVLKSKKAKTTVKFHA